MHSAVIYLLVKLEGNFLLRIIVEKLPESASVMRAAAAVRMHTP